MTNSKKVLSIVVIAVLLSTIATMVFATNDDFIIINGTNMDNNPTDINNVTDLNNVASPLNTIGNTTNTTSNTSTYSNTVNNLPKTGAGDYTMVLTIAGLVIVAIYAYKKVNDYKNI